MESYRYFCKIENFAYGEINERSFSNPHPCSEISHDNKCDKSSTPATVYSLVMKQHHALYVYQILVEVKCADIYI